MGPITSDLTLDDSEMYLDIRDVRIAGRDATGNTVKVKLSGKVNCNTLEIEEGRLEKGRYRIASTRSALSFEGAVQGSYTSAPYAVNGNMVRLRSSR